MKAIPNLAQRYRKERFFRLFCMGAAIFGVTLLVLLLVGIGKDGIGRLNGSFLNSFPSRFPERAGIKSALYGSIWILCTTMAMAMPIGIAAAIYLEEFATQNRLAKFIQLNIANLAGVPSIIFGLLGLGMFVRGMGLGRSIIAGSLTLALLILPTIILATQEALRAVPASLRDASFGVGATPWQTVRLQVLPAAFPGILTGIILALSRAIGETAPLITMGALTYVAFVPTGLFAKDGFTVMPIQIFNWASRPQAGFHTDAAAGIIVLLTLLLSMNIFAIVLRYKARKRLS